MVQAMLLMGKLDVRRLQEAYDGEWPSLRAARNCSVANASTTIATATTRSRARGVN